MIEANKISFIKLNLENKFFNRFLGQSSSKEMTASAYAYVK